MHVLMILFFTSELNAQESGIRGVIRDSNSFETVPLVTIIKEGTAIGTSSDNEGNYQLELAPGIHSIQFSTLAYEDTLIQVRINTNEFVYLEIHLKEDLLLLDEIVVSADRSVRMVQQLAVFREKQNKNLHSYTADLHKIAILGKANIQDNIDFSPLAYSERVSQIKHIISPERFMESMSANRASKNFFSEYDFFSTGGPPLNLNQELVSLSILSEDITVIGPISKRAGKFYFIDDNYASDEWPEGTREITFLPKQNNRPLFKGSVWVNEITSAILGIDVTLSEYSTTNNGLFSISNFRYQQTYTNIGDYWLPENTKLSANLQFLASSSTITYLDEWSWSNHKINPDLSFNDLSLNTLSIEAGANRNSMSFWDSLSIESTNDNLLFLEDAESYHEKNRALRLGMGFMSSFFRLPYKLERSYLTNISDIYHYNRVEGHTIGLGLRTPFHTDYKYSGNIGYGLSNKNWIYTLNGYHFLKRYNIAPEILLFKVIVHQYQDYEYNRTPLDFFEFQHSMSALINGSPINNYFLREGIQLGFRYRFDIESFLRVLYLNENHHSVKANTGFSLFDNIKKSKLYKNNPIPNEDLTGLSIHLHHDTRKYLRTQFLRDYNIRDFGWLIDAKLEKGISHWGSDLEYNRYRIGIKLNIPIFSAHFIQTDLILGASDTGTPSQRLFNYNGFVLDDYVRERYFNTVSYKEPTGSRVSVLKVKYKFGSSITRKIPISFIQKSGIQLATFLSVGTIDYTSNLMPILPYSKSQTQAEVGIAAFKIFGFIYAEYSLRIIGDFGNSFGFQVLL